MTSCGLRFGRLLKRKTNFEGRCLFSDRPYAKKSKEIQLNRVPMKDELAAGGSYHVTPTGDSDAPQKTTMTPLKLQLQASKSLGVATMSREGFRLVDNTFLWGPVALFPKVALSWKVATQDDITDESLEFLTLLEPKLDIVVVGVGGREFVDPVRRRIFRMFSKCKIGLEVLPTYDAISTFNWLNADGRYIGAALFPPKKVELGYLQAMETMFDLQTPDIVETDWYEFGFHPDTYKRHIKGGSRREKEEREKLEDEVNREARKKLEEEEKKRLT